MTGQSLRVIHPGLQLASDELQGTDRPKLIQWYTTLHSLHVKRSGLHFDSQAHTEQRAQKFAVHQSMSHAAQTVLCKSPEVFRHNDGVKAYKLVLLVNSLSFTNLDISSWPFFSWLIDFILPWPKKIETATQGKHRRVHTWCCISHFHSHRDSSFEFRKCLRQK